MLEMNGEDVRWKQRFQNYEKAFKRLSRAIEVVKATPDDDLLQSGLVQTYEYTFELAWKTLKDYLEMEGFLLRSPRETIRQGFQGGYITNAEDWLQVLADRNLTVHIYDDEIIIRVLKDILNAASSFSKSFIMPSKEKKMPDFQWEKCGISDRDGRRVVDILSAFDEVREAVLFGSRAKGNYKPGSDIDIAVKGDVSKDVLSRLLAAFEESVLPYFVDVVAYDSLKNEAFRGGMWIG